MSRRPTGGRVRGIIFLALSVVIALVASLVIYTVISRFQTELVNAQMPEEAITVMVAAKDIAQGHTIGQEDLKLTQLPSDYVPDAVLRQYEEAIGRVPRERILKDEFIREERLADKEAGIGLNAIIPRGMRALSINITNGSAVSGFLNPGNYVDVILTIKTQGQEEQAETNTLLQAVPVLAVNNRLGTDAATESRGGEAIKPSVTVAVTPEQAEKLAHAVSQGVVTLTLRNDIDVTSVETNGAFTDQLLGGGGEEGEAKRIPVKEWRARAATKTDGSLIIIKGQDIETEKVRP